MQLKIKTYKNLYFQQSLFLNQVKNEIKNPRLRAVTPRTRKRFKIYSNDNSGPQMESLDMTSKGGLGGTSEEVFGPLAILLIG